jgi:hypothetical protein
MTHTYFDFFRKNTSQRSIVNIGFNQGMDFRFINFFRAAEQWGPGGGTLWYTDPTRVWTQSLGSNGYPNVRSVSPDFAFFGGGIRIPSSRVYGAVGSSQYYVLRWKGSGTIQLGVSGGASYVSAQSSNVTFTAPATFTTTSGSDGYAVFQVSSQADLFPVYITETDKTNTGAFVHDIEFYRKDDEADRDAGKIFRRPYLEWIKNLDPAAIRFMDWFGGNDCHMVRWEHRNSPLQEGWGWGGQNWIAGPRYGITTNTVNDYTLAAATGTPASMQHGEVAQFKIGTGAVRTTNVAVTAITNGANGRVTAPGHTYLTGDKVNIFFNDGDKSGDITSGSNVITCSTTGLAVGMSVSNKRFPAGTVIQSINPGVSITVTNNATATGSIQFKYMAMPKLHLRIATITKIDADNFDLNIDTTSLGAFAGVATAQGVVRMQVGSGNDRHMYPVVYAAGPVNAGFYAPDYWKTNDYKNVVFDKTYAAEKDASGNWLYGAWIFPDNGSNLALNSGMPPEVCTALINEVNALGPVNPIHMWINVPVLGMCSMDPDYDAAQHMGVNLVNTILNGANGYAGLNSNCDLFVEFSNETWNQGGNAFSQSYLLGYRGYLRWNGASQSDVSSFSTLRSSIVMDDIRQANASPRIKCILAGQGSAGAGAGVGDSGGNVNDIRIDGSSFYHADPLVTGNPRLSGKKPMQYPHDYFAFACYAYHADDTVLQGYANTWVAAVADPVAQEAACASMVNDMLNGTNGAGGEIMKRYGEQVLPSFAAKLAPMRKSAICYEGGTDHNCTNVIGGDGQGGVSTAFTKCTITTGSNVLTNVNDTSTFTVGDFVYGDGIPDNSRIASKTANSITLTAGKNATITSDVGEFLVFTPFMAYIKATKRSKAWSDGFISWFNKFALYPNTGMPADYIALGPRWGHIWPNSYGYGHTEFTDHDQVWTDEGIRNRSFSEGGVGGGGGSSGGSRTITYRGANNYGVGAVQTASIDIGTASADRRVIVACSSQNANTITSVTVNGVALTQRLYDTSNDTIALFDGIVSTGDGLQP